MALRGAAARRYAQAIFDIASENNQLDKWLADLKLLNGIFGSDTAIDVLENPNVTEEQQQQIIRERIPKEVDNPLALNLLFMLADRQRLALLPRILESFQEMYNQAKGILVAEVVTAVPLDAARQKQVADRLARITGKTIQLQVRQDPRILGGMITRIGDQLIDASVANRLFELSERLA